jgi:hypothetical protein
MKNKPLLLKGGYSEWILTCPMFSSNPNVFVSGSKFNISQKQLPLDFNTAIPGTALSLIPDRSMKPKFQNEDIKSTNQKSIQLVNDFEKIKLIKQNEATEQMLSSLQEGIDQKMNSYEQQLKEKYEMINKKDELIKKKEEENKAFRKFLPQKPISNEKNIVSINGDISNSDKRNGEQKTMNDINSTHSNVEKIKYLESKIAEIEEANSCTICMIPYTHNGVSRMAFLCGHSACFNCAQTLKTCHMCRKTITRKINLY